MSVSKGILAVPALALVLGVGCEKTEETTIVNQAPQARIALLADVNYVEYDASDSECEGSNTQASLEALGHRVLPFFGIDAATLAAALQDKDTLVIPELENGDLNAGLSPESRGIIARFVSGGGTLVFCYADDSAVGFINVTFGFSLSYSKPMTPITINAAGAAGTPFAISPAELHVNDATSTLSAPSLPSDARIIYEEALHGDAVVAVLPYGNGRIVFLGWDWFDAYPIGTQDGGWNLVLDRAVSW